nr:hypothetical protein PoMZ_09965 [Ipomoea batatas]
MWIPPLQLKLHEHKLGDRAWIVGQFENPSKPVQAIPNSDINGLPENSVPPFAISYDLSIPSADVQHNRVNCACHDPAHLNMRDAVIHRDDWLLPELGEDADDHRGDLLSVNAPPEILAVGVLERERAVPIFLAPIGL